MMKRDKGQDQRKCASYDKASVREKTELMRFECRNRRNEKRQWMTQRMHLALSHSINSIECLGFFRFSCNLTSIQLFLIKKRSWQISTCIRASTLNIHWDIREKRKMILTLSIDNFFFMQSYNLLLLLHLTFSMIHNWSNFIHSLNLLHRDLLVLYRSVSLDKMLPLLFQCKWSECNDIFKSELVPVVDWREKDDANAENNSIENSFVITDRPVPSFL